MKRPLAALVLAFPVVVFAAGFRSTELSDDQRNLIITESDGARFDAPKFPEQAEYSHPRISANGRYVGWLALFPNCCTSYPIPLKLVVLDDSRQLHTFEGIRLAVFAWCFTASSTSVAYSQGVLHGSDFRHFELRRIADSHLLANYEYPHGEAEVARRHAPSWVRCVPE